MSVEFKAGDRVLVREDRRSDPFEGTVVYTDVGFGNQLWIYVEPDEFGVIIRRGSGNSEYSLGYFGVMLGLADVQHIS